MDNQILKAIFNYLQSNLASNYDYQIMITESQIITSVEDKLNKLKSNGIT